MLVVFLAAAEVHNIHELHRKVCYPLNHCIFLGAGLLT